MVKTTSLCALCGLTALTTAARIPYNLVDDYRPANFVSKFNFFTDHDPTHGFVQYTNRSYASRSALIQTTPRNTLRINVDTTHTYNPSTSLGRPSIRLESKKRYTRGLYILSLNHMPFGCGTWPAFWTYGADWPSRGEIDIIEGVNTNAKNLFTLHTSEGCTVAGSGQAGTLLTNDCYWRAANNAGCSTIGKNPASYGEVFNRNGGGVFAMEWTARGIKMWFWPHARVPGSIKTGQPDVDAFGIPSANFAGSCDFEAKFREHMLVFDTTFCGDFAGNTYASAGCPMRQGMDGMESCRAFVGGNPQAFTEAYWDINWLRVYQTATGVSPLPRTSTALKSVTPLASTVSEISSSLASAGMGKDTSTTILSRSSDVVPSSNVAIAAKASGTSPDGFDPAAASAPAHSMTPAEQRSSSTPMTDAAFPTAPPALAGNDPGTTTITVWTVTTITSCPTPVVCPKTQAMVTISYGFHSAGPLPAPPISASSNPYVNSSLPLGQNSSAVLTVLRNGTTGLTTAPLTASVTALINGSLVTTTAGGPQFRKIPPPPKPKPKPKACLFGVCYRPAQGI